MLPAGDPLYLCSPPSLFRIDLVAELAFLAKGNGLHDKFHAARLACSVFSVAVLSEVAPLPVAAGKSMLVEEAHVSRLLPSAEELSYYHQPAPKDRLTANTSRVKLTVTDLFCLDNGQKTVTERG